MAERYITPMTSNTLLIVVPSLGRPQNAARLLERFLSTTTYRDGAYLTFAVEDNDPTVLEYPYAYTHPVKGGSMVQALNEVAVEQASNFDYLAFLGDDTLPYDGWLPKIMEALQGKNNSIVYGNDLHHGENLPTSVFMDSNIVRTLGYMAPPNQKQIFVDNYWKALGEDLGTLIYLDDVIIEHLHPNFGKAPSDASYALSNGPERWRHDEEAFITHMNGQYLKDLEKLK